MHVGEFQEFMSVEATIYLESEPEDNYWNNYPLN